MAWERVLSDLADLYASLIRDPAEAETVAQKIGLNPENLRIYGQKPSVFWMNIVEEARNQQVLDNLVEFVKKRYPKVNFPALVQAADRSAPPGPKPEDERWNVPATEAGGLEKIIGSQSTLLPISFLETGVRRARSVAKVETPSGSGTGFLVDRNLLITNHHVIPSRDIARATRARFNFQVNDRGLAQESVTFELDSDGDGQFATSPVEGGDDWTAVRLKGDANRDWGLLELSDAATVKKDDFVNIIQHPAGMPKQIALYHNVVAYVDPEETRVQYLTDTMPGASGAPVFDSNWRLVALHHSGGWLTQPGSKEVFFRNEGIHIRALIRGLKASGMLGA